MRSGSHEVPDGKYLYDPATRQIEMQWVQGIGSDQAAAPQARLMATVISGILNQRLPWRLVFLGVFLVIAVELLGVRSLPFAVGSYLSIATTMAMFAGGLVRWLAERGTGEKERRGKRSQSGIALCQRIDRGGRRVRLARDYSESAAGPGTEQARAALAGLRCCTCHGRRKCLRSAKSFPRLAARQASACCCLCCSPFRCSFPREKNWGKVSAAMIHALPTREIACHPQATGGINSSNVQR